ncbi:MAG: LysR family transcriptional regulator, partial [Phycisphaerales bacterium]|nr:LysR family transcriptional regulator [Phycisphaerales bacterium]
MDELNFNHLRSFWAVAREGSVTRAGQLLDLTQPTVSKQVAELEDSLGADLFQRTGRRLQLTETGRLVYGYADEIFSTAQSLRDAMRTRSEAARALKVVVGITDAVPTLLSRLVLEPGMALDQRVRMVCRLDKTERLLADLSIGALDVVVADAPLPSSARVKAYNHLLGECAVAAFGTDQLRARYQRGFPRSLDGAPVLVPTENVALRFALEQWFTSLRIRPDVVAEIEDGALLKVFAQARHGLFFAPSILRPQLRREYNVHQVGVIEEVTEQFFAISVER